MGKNNIKAMNIRKATGMKNINPTNYELIPACRQAGEYTNNRARQQVSE